MDEIVIYQKLADAVLAMHTLLVAFVIGGLVLVLLGNRLGWRWVNNLVFRLAHLAIIAVVVAESWLGITCPLTTLEAWLRGRAMQTAYSRSFIEHWLQQILFYEAPTWVFGAVYTAFGALVVASWVWYPPRFERPSRMPEAEAPAPAQDRAAS
jgi:MFS family permease